MKRLLIAALLIVACLCTVIAYGIQANSGGRVEYGTFSPSGGDGIIEYVFPTGAYLPSGFTMHTADGSAFCFQRRFGSGLRDTVRICVPAGSSYTVPSPGGFASGDSTYITIFVSGHTDTLFSVPWYR